MFYDVSAHTSERLLQTLKMRAVSIKYFARDSFTPTTTYKRLGGKNAAKGGKNAADQPEPRA